MAKARATKTRETRDDARVGLDADAGARAEDAGEGRRETGTRDETRGDGDGDADADGTGAELVRYHRDYLPDGKIWEQAPVVGPLVKFQRETYVGCMMSPRGCADLLGAPK